MEIKVKIVHVKTVKITVHVQWILPNFFNSSLNSSMVWQLFRFKEKLFHKRLPLRINELIPNFTDLAGGNNNLFPFLKL